MGNYLTVFTEAVCSTLILNNNTLAQENETENLWTEATANIGNAWLHQTGGDQPFGLEYDIDHLDQNGFTFDTLMGNIANGQYSDSQFSSDAINHLLGVLAKNWDAWNGRPGVAGGYQAELSQRESLIQAQSSQDTQTGDSETKAEVSTLQNSTSAGQTIADAGESVLQQLSSGSNAQASISA